MFLNNKNIINSVLFFILFFSIIPLCYLNQIVSRILCSILLIFLEINIKKNMEYLFIVINNMDCLFMLFF